LDYPFQNKRFGRGSLPYISLQDRVRSSQNPLFSEWKISVASTGLGEEQAKSLWIENASVSIVELTAHQQACVLTMGWSPY
jgi:hypothetical protein